MKHLLRLSDLTRDDVSEIFHIADELISGDYYRDYFKGRTFVMFFPSSSIRTRVTFEKGIYLLGGQSILFEPETLDKKEDIGDVIGYLNQWADGIIIRYPDITRLEDTSSYSSVPVINAMTEVNHPCEILADLYTLSKIRKDFTKDRFLFVGPAGNIGRTWQEASDLMGFSLQQCCPDQYRMEGVKSYSNIENAIIGKDIICTDSICEKYKQDFNSYQITTKIMHMANDHAVLNPCPPFYRGEEVSAEVIDSEYFVGHKFKRNLLEIQQSILIWSLLIQD